MQTRTRAWRHRRLTQGSPNWSPFEQRSVLPAERQGWPKCQHLQRRRRRDPELTFTVACAPPKAIYVAPFVVAASLVDKTPTNQGRPRYPPGSTGGSRSSATATPSPTRCRRGAACNSTRPSPRAAALRVARESRPRQANGERAWHALDVAGGRTMALPPTARHCPSLLGDFPRSRNLKICRQARRAYVVHLETAAGVGATKYTSKTGRQKIVAIFLRDQKR